MPNTFITPTEVVRDAALILQDQLIVGNLANRSLESNFGKKIGNTVKVKVPPTGSASEFSSTTSADAVTETSVDVTLTKHFYRRVDLTSDEMTLSVDDFNTLVTMPSIRALVASLEDFFLARACGGFSSQLAGTAGVEPSTQAHILAAEKRLFDSKADISQLVGVISSTAHASFAALAQFTSADYGSNRPAGLASNSLGKMAGIDWYRTPYSGSFARGDVAGSVTATGTAAASTVALAAFSSASGTLYEGTRFTIAGDATIYTVTANATIASNACTAYVYPVLATSPSGAAVTFETAFKENLVYNPSALAVAIVPPAVAGPGTAAASINGVGLRIIQDISISTLANSWVFDVYAGAKVCKREYGCIMNG